jgi:hypothetical protein
MNEKLRAYLKNGFITLGVVLIIIGIIWSLILNHNLRGMMGWILSGIISFLLAIILVVPED